MWQSLRIAALPEVKPYNMEDMAFIGATVLDAETFLKEGVVMKNVVQEVRDRVEADETAPE